MTYVVLHHSGHGAPHFDLMVERPDADGLATWRLPTWPPTGPIAAVALADHRRHYLTHEGPVSGGRGTVRRVASGAADDAGRIEVDGAWWAVRDGVLRRATGP